jgi:hypothetical protein
MAEQGRNRRFGETEIIGDRCKTVTKPVRRYV